MDEKRGFTRFSFNKKIELRTDSDETISVSVIDLSLQGASITVDGDGAFEIGKHFAFSMVFRDDEAITIKGEARIMWSEGGTYGLQFENMGPDYFTNLKRLLELNYDEKP